MTDNQPAVPWRKIWVTIETADTPDASVFPAWTRGKEWNGFATPYFDLATAHEVAKWTRSFPAGESEVVSWNEDLGLFIGTGKFGNEEYEQRYGPTEVPGVGLCYAIGAWTWTWDRVSDRRSAGALEPVMNLVHLREGRNTS